MDVYVCVSLVSDLQTRETLRPDDYKVIAWAELYRTEEDAQRKEM